MLSKLPTCPFAGSSLCPKCPLLNHLSLKKKCVYIYLFIPFIWLCQVSAAAGRIFIAGQGLSSCNRRATLPHSMWDLSPQPGIKPQPLNWKADFSTTGPPGKSPQSPVLKAPVTWTLTQCHGPQKAFPPARKKRTPAPLAIECTLLSV